MKASLERAIEATTGQTIDNLRNMPLDTLRRLIEKKRQSAVVITRNFPFLGRGNVMRDETISRDEVEKQLDEALR